MSALRNCTRCEVCEAAASIYAPLSFVHFSLLFRLFLEPLCTIGMLILTTAVYQTRALHFNARTLLFCMTFSVSISNVGVLLDASYKLFVAFVLPEELRCDYQVFKPYYLLFIRGIYVFGGLGLVLSTSFLAAERSLATISYDTYEQHSRRWIGLLLTSIQVLVCFATAVSISVPPQIYPYVTSDTEDTKRARNFGYILFFSNIMALLVFAALYLINRRRKSHILPLQRNLEASKLGVLSTRFQLRENIATTRSMAPIMFVVALTTTSSQMIYEFRMPDLSKDTVVTTDVLKEVSESAPYSEYQMSLMPLMSLMLIYLLPCFNVHIKRSFIRLCHLTKYFPEPGATADAVTVSEARDLYFSRLSGQWRLEAHSSTHF